MWYRIPTVSIIDTIVEVVKCISYDESDMEQKFISKDDFFYRHSYSTNTKLLSVSSYEQTTSLKYADCTKFNSHRRDEHAYVETLTIRIPHR